MIADADRAGIDVHVHACGERTARTALDAFEAAIAANPPRDRRHAIAHNVLTEDSDIPRFGKPPASHWRLAQTALRSAPTFDLTPKARAARAKVRTVARSGLDGDRPAASRVPMRRVMRAFRRRRRHWRGSRLTHDGRGLRARCAATIGLEQSEPRQALDRPQEIALFMVAERNRLSCFARSRGAADAMNIGLGDLRQFKIDDMADAVDVDAARRDVGRNQRPRLSAAEGGQARARAGPGSCCHESRKR